MSLPHVLHRVPLCNMARLFLNLASGRIILIRCLATTSKPFRHGDLDILEAFFAVTLSDVPRSCYDVAVVLNDPYVLQTICDWFKGRHRTIIVKRSVVVQNKFQKGFVQRGFWSFADRCIVDHLVPFLFDLGAFVIMPSEHHIETLWLSWDPALKAIAHFILML